MKKRILTALTVLFAVLFAVSGVMTAYAVSTTDAKEAPDLQKACTLTVSYTHGGKAFSEQDIKLWYIAALTDKAQYELDGSFKEYPVSVTGTKSQTEWNEMTVTLNSYILADGIAPDCESKSDKGGTATFAGLKPGLYLVGSVRNSDNGKLTVFESFMVAVPGVNESDAWQYDVTAKPKAEENTPSKGEVAYQAVKIWKDAGSKAKRPDSVTAEIYRDGALQENITLSDENGWTYEWKAIDDGSVWSVTEKNVPQDYKVGIQRNGDVFQITNVSENHEKAPQTGDTSNIRLYLILLILSGTVLIALSIIHIRSNRHES